jgi:hypothetical protein
MRECPSCKRSYRHDGKCYEENSSKPCLIFERDPRGKQLYLENDKFQLDFGNDIPKIGKPDDRWQINGIDKTITVSKIRKVEWNSNVKGLHGIYIWVDYMYWSDENGVIVDKPRLVLCR